MILPTIEKIKNYLKEEFNINSLEELNDAISNSKGLDISIFISEF